jgi:hypothetical protein
MTRTFAQLKHLIGTLEGSPLREEWPCSDTAGGLPRGAITEICGPGKTEFIVKFLKEHLELRVAWVEPNLSIYPTGLLQRELRLDRILFVEAENEFPWVVQQLFKSNLFEIVILLSTLSDSKMLRRFQLSAEKAHASLILLSEAFSKGWPVALQLKSSRKEGGRVHVDLIRKR